MCSHVEPSGPGVGELSPLASWLKVGGYYMHQKSQAEPVWTTKQDPVSKTQNK